MRRSGGYAASVWRINAACAMSMVRFITSNLPSLGTGIGSASRMASASSASVPSSAEPLNRLSTERAAGVSSNDRAALVSKQRRRVAPHPGQQFAARAGIGCVAVARVVSVEADGDRDVGVDRGDRRHGQRVEDASVGEQPAVEFVRGDHPRDRDGRADRLVDRAALKPHRLAGDQVGADRRVRDRKLLDQHLTEDFADLVENLLRAQHAGRGQRGVEQAKHRALRQRACPLGIFIELARRLEAADERTHG